MRVIRVIIAAAAFTLAALLLYRALEPFSAQEILGSLSAISARHVLAALAFTAASFVCLAGSDALAVRYTARALPLRRVALASFISVSIGHTLGFAAVSSGALRFRLYTGWGLSGGDVARILLFCGTTAVLGMTTLAGIASLANPAVLASLLRVPASMAQGIGAGLLAAIGMYLGLARFVHRPIRIRRFVLPVPRLRLALAQVAVGTADQLMVAAVLHQLLSAAIDTPYTTVATAYVTANAAGAAAHVPGGLGVVEAVVLAFVPGAGAGAIGALIAFRALYYLLPFALGCAAFGITEWMRRRA